MNEKELNAVKFVASCLLLIFGRKMKNDVILIPYEWEEACETIDKIAKHHEPTENFL